MHRTQHSPHHTSSVVSSTITSPMFSALSSSSPRFQARCAPWFLSPAVLLAISWPALGAPNEQPLRPVTMRLAQAQTNAPAASVDKQEKLVVPLDDKDKKETPTTEVKPEDGTVTTGEPGMSPAPTVSTSPAETPDATTSTAVPSSELEDAQAEGREIADVRVVGNRVVPAESILLQAATRRGAAYSTRQIELDKQKIDALGFFAAVAHQVTPNLEDPSKVDVTFIVTENRVVQTFKFEGNTAVKAEDLLVALESKTGAVLNRNTVNRDVAKVQDLYKARGYAVLVTDVRQGADGTVTFILQEAKVCKVDVSGLGKTRPSLVRSQIRTKPGDIFDQVAIRRDLNRIYDLGFFEDVNFKVDDDPVTPGCLIVTIGVKEKRTGQFTVGVGFDSRSKITGFLTLSENNLRGTGRRVFGSVEAGGQRTFDLGFGDPFVGKKNAGYDISIFDRRIFREPRSIQGVLPGAGGGGGGGNAVTFFYEERRTGARVSYNQPLDLNRTQNLLFGYRNEKARLFTTTNVGTAVPINLPANAVGRTSAVSFGFLRDKRDLRLDPSRGGREQVLLEKAFSLLGGNNNFTKIDLDLRRYFPLIGAPKPGELPKLVVAGRLVVGKSFGQLPAFEQYFIGGSETVRGYDVDEQFGDNQIYSNLELRYRIQRKFQVVGFVDAGKAAGGRFSSTDDRALYSVGAGIRVQTPIGPIRLDIGKGLGSGASGIRTHFAIGPTF